MKKIALLAIIIFKCQIISAQVTDTLKTSTDTVAKVTSPASAPPAKTRRDTRPFNERVSLGFGTGFWITPTQTYIEVAPVIAYRFPKVLITGVGYRYIYRHQRVINNDLNSWGPNVFARLNLTKRIYLWTEYEFLNTQYFNNSYSGDESKTKSSTDSWFAGIGYMRSFGRKGKGGISLQVLYNFLYEREDYSPYYSPVTYRVGYFF